MYIFLGISMVSSCTGVVFVNVDFPFIVATSGPKMFVAILASYMVTGLFLMRLDRMKYLNV